MCSFSPCKPINLESGLKKKNYCLQPVNDTILMQSDMSVILLLNRGMWRIGPVTHVLSAIDSSSAVIDVKPYHNTKHITHVWGFYDVYILYTCTLCYLTHLKENINENENELSLS